MDVFIANESTTASDSDIQAALPAMQHYAGLVARYWPRGCKLHFVALSDLPADRWQIIILDNSDQAGALGDHDYTPGGKPIAKIFAADELKYGVSLTEVMTHELAEMIADPYISTAVQITDTKFYALEICDPVEDSSYDLQIQAPGTDLVVPCSNFVTPAWFIPGHPGPIFDFGRHSTKPCQILSGGYMSVYTSGAGWKQIYARQAPDGAEESGTSSLVEVPLDVKGALSRPARYARRRGEQIHVP